MTESHQPIANPADYLQRKMASQSGFAAGTGYREFQAAVIGFREFFWNSSVEQYKS
jgi:hypothetical protein